MAELFNESPLVFVAVVFAFALVIGSFLNVVIYRLPIMMDIEEREWFDHVKAAHAKERPPALPEKPFNVVVPRSRCPSCGRPIAAWQNIPVISYMMLGGRCGNCKKTIAARYPLVEFVTAALAAFAAWRFGFGWEAVMAAVMTFALVPITMIDYDRQLIPDVIVLPLMWIGLAMSLFHPLEGADTLFVSPTDAIAGAMLGYLSLWTVYKLYKLVTGKEGMGYGDFKLLAALGAWLGWQQVPAIILMSAAVGAIVGISLIVFQGRDKNKPIPFGPYLAAAGWIVMLYGDEISELYFSLFNLTP